ncbi:MAG TPA: SLBB domain-containing protein [Longimicrobiales bacterium]
MTRTHAALILVLLLAPAWASAQGVAGASDKPSKSSPGVSAPADAAVTLRPGDAVRLAVKDEPSLAGEFPINQTGDALLPEIGLVRVAGRDFEDVGREVRAAFARKLIGAEIVLVPVARIAVLGEVRKPGLFPVDPSLTLGDVLASAGGLTPDGNPHNIALVRGGRTSRLRLAAEEPALLGHLRSGDQIVVGQYGWVRQNLPTLVGAGASVVAAAVTSLILRH